MKKILYFFAVSIIFNLFTSCTKKQEPIIEKEKPISELVVGTWKETKVTDSHIVTDITDVFGNDSTWTRTLRTYDAVSGKEILSESLKGTYTIGSIDKNMNFNDSIISINVTEKTKDGEFIPTFEELYIRIKIIGENNLEYKNYSMIEGESLSSYVRKREK